METCVVCVLENKIFNLREKKTESGEKIYDDKNHVEYWRNLRFKDALLLCLGSFARRKIKEMGPKICVAGNSN